MMQTAAMAFSRTLRSFHLIVAVLLITGLAQVLVTLRLAGALYGMADFLLAWLLIVANLAVAAAGWRTPQRLAWMIYLVLSLVGLVLMGAATPISALILAWYLVVG